MERHKLTSLGGEFLLLITRVLIVGAFIGIPLFLLSPFLWILGSINPFTKSCDALSSLAFNEEPTNQTN